jgi:hypothetical protein
VPDPYSDGIAKLRAAQGIEIKEIADDDPRLRAMAKFRAEYVDTFVAPHVLPPATGDVYAKPPDPYQIALGRTKGDAR